MITYIKMYDIANLKKILIRPTPPNRRIIHFLQLISALEKINSLLFKLLPNVNVRMPNRREEHSWGLDIHLSKIFLANKLEDKIVVPSTGVPSFLILCSTFPHCLLACILHSMISDIPTYI